MFVADDCNNINRHCSLAHDTKNRRWRVLRAVRTKKIDGYLLVNVDTKEHRVAQLRDMGNLY